MIQVFVCISEPFFFGKNAAAILLPVNAPKRFFIREHGAQIGLDKFHVFLFSCFASDFGDEVSVLFAACQKG